MTTHPAVVAAALARLTEIERGPREELIRVRTTPKFKEEFAKYSAAMGLPSATNAYKLMRDAVKAHVRQQLPGRTGAGRGPIRPVIARRNL